MNKATKDLLEFWEEQMKQSHTSSNYFFRKSPSHYHMMLLVMSAYKLNVNSFRGNESLQLMIESIESL